MNTTPGFPACRTFTTTLIVILTLSAGALGQMPDSGAASQPDVSTVQPGTSTPQSSAAVAAIEKAADPSAAVEAYAKAGADAHADPQLAVAYVHRMVALGAPHLAQKQAKEVVSHDPNDGVAWAVLAFCDGAMNNTSAALNELTKATHLAPDDEFVQYTAGQLLGWYDALGEASDLPPGLPEKLKYIKEDFASRPAFAETYKGALRFYKQQPAAGKSAGAPAAASPAEPPAGAPAAPSPSASTPVDTGSVTPGPSATVNRDVPPAPSAESSLGWAPSATVNRDVPPADANKLPPPVRVIIPEKIPFQLPNGQTLVLFDHKVGDDQVRYKVDGVEYKPHVGTTIAFPGPGYLVLVTCTRWKLPKKDYGRDSAEFQIQCVPSPGPQVPANVAPAPQASADAAELSPAPVGPAVQYVPASYPTYIIPTYYPAYPGWSVGVGFGWGYPWWGGCGWGGYYYGPGRYGYNGRWRSYGGGWYGHGGGWQGSGYGNHVRPYGRGGYAGVSHGSGGGGRNSGGAGYGSTTGSHGSSGASHSLGGGGRSLGGGRQIANGGGRSFSGGSHSSGGGSRNFGGVRTLGAGPQGFAGASRGFSSGTRSLGVGGRAFAGGQGSRGR